MAIDPGTTTLAELYLSGKATEAQVAGRSIARLFAIMQSWEARPLEFRNLPNKQYKISQWISELTYIMNNPLQNVMDTSGYFGYVTTNKVMGLNFSQAAFYESYEKLLSIQQGLNNSKAFLLESSLAQRWSGNYEQYYKLFDEYILESRRLGLSLSQQFKMFNTQGLGRDFVSLVDTIGRKWEPRHYMNLYSVTRATEVTSKTTLQVMSDNGEQFVRVSDHNTTTPICIQYEGKFYSITDNKSGLPKLDVYPPFHPFCKHILLPAGDFERSMIEDNSEIDSRIPDFTASEQEAIKRQEAFNRIEIQGRKNEKIS